MRIPVYGKTMENLRNRVDVKTSNQRERLFAVDIESKLHIAKNIW